MATSFTRLVEGQEFPKPKFAFADVAGLLPADVESQITEVHLDNAGDVEKVVFETNAPPVTLEWLTNEVLFWDPGPATPILQKAPSAAFNGEFTPV